MQTLQLMWAVLFRKLFEALKAFLVDKKASQVILSESPPLELVYKVSFTV